MSRETPRVTIARDGSRWQLACTQWVPLPPADVFPFFASAQNLEQLTPDFLKFRILRAPTTALRAGSTLDYRIRLHGLPVSWRTRIDEWRPPHGFVDVQIRGPFRVWRHRHQFVEQAGGTRLVDEVQFDVYCRPLYRTPLLGWIDTDLRRIFEYRHTQVARIFGGERAIGC